MNSERKRVLSPEDWSSQRLRVEVGQLSRKRERNSSVRSIEGSLCERNVSLL